ncbi:hypothetical protein L1987_76794 [Smallanthus sonchifolius]|uniref:Uncharacterized protein n=1 Tax=Smallanthus sonchifolius TaxID=185202 RepID=A0ACB8Z982_9ASTR|nr:hypothetical protein L1987_76794 [Smallanthus sonchifolius]
MTRHSSTKAEIPKATALLLLKSFNNSNIMLVLLSTILLQGFKPEIHLEVWNQQHILYKETGKDLTVVHPGRIL